VRVGVLTVSDRVSRGEAEDGSGDLLEELLRGDGFEVERKLVPDERAEISAALRDLASHTQIVLTTGGTGLAPRDITPEATLDVLEREAPGIAQALRVEGLHKTPYALLSRGVAGLIGSTLIVNLPGSTGGCRPVLPHALELLGGKVHVTHKPSE
jgi:molybdenum cofactor biosynthesis protein B